MDDEVAELREQLCKLVESLEIDSNEVLALSQKLDIFILEYYK